MISEFEIQQKIITLPIVSNLTECFSTCDRICHTLLESRILSCYLSGAKDAGSSIFVHAGNIDLPGVDRNHFHAVTLVDVFAVGNHIHPAVTQPDCSG